MTQHPVATLPKPRPERAGKRTLTLFALLLLLIAGGAGFWLTRSDEARTHYKERLAGLLTDTPLAPLASWLQPPSSLPVRVTHPLTQPGTLAGQTVQGTMPSLPSPAVVSEGTDSTADADGTQATPETPSLTAPLVTEDQVVRVYFIEDLARWLVARFHPEKDNAVQVTAQTLNMRFGGQMPGLVRPETSAKDVSPRAAVLRYAFNPPMLTALYALYIDRFMEALHHAATQAPLQSTVPSRDDKTLTPAQTSALYQAYSTRIAACAGALNAIATMADFDARMREISAFATQALDAHQKMTEAIFALDSARESGNQTGMETAQLRVSGTNAQYQKYMAEYHAAQRALCADIRKAASAARILDDDNLLYIAGWIERRHKADIADAQSRQTALTAAGLLEDLARRLNAAASAAP